MLLFHVCSSHAMRCNAKPEPEPDPIVRTSVLQHTHIVDSYVLPLS